MTVRLIAILALVALAACQDEAAREQACTDKLVADFNREADLAIKDGNHEYAIVARQSAISALLIASDDDRNACEYVSAGNRLERK